jgi:hypothetical protein
VTERKLPRFGLWFVTALGYGAFATTLGACSGDVDKASSEDLGAPTGSGARGNTATGGTGASMPGSGGSGGFAGAATGGGAGAMGGGTEPPPPPEMELESAFEAPVATNRFVWTANPTTNRVALINAETFEVRLAETGLAPSTVAGLPGDGQDGAIVLNLGSEDATIVRVDSEGNLTSTNVPTHAGATAVAVSAGGSWAIAWSSAEVIGEENLDPTDGLQDVTVIDLRGEEPRSTVLSVGYRPSRVDFDERETRAFIVTEPGLSVIELDDAPRADRLLELTDDPIQDQAARDVNVTPDGSLAVVRVDAKTTLGFVDTETGERTTLDLGSFVSDLDLSSDGTQAFAVAGAELVVVPVPPGSITGAELQRASVEGVIGRSVSISPDSTLALLYSNAEENPYLTVLTTDSEWSDFEGHALDLHAPVRAAFAAPSGLHGIAFQATAEGSRKAGAFSIVSAQVDRAPKIIGTDAPPIAVAYSPDGSNAVIATRDLVNASYGMYLVYLDNLEENFYSLPSPPLAAGMVPTSNQAFVAQAHPEGRITFVNLVDGSARTLTGFELTAKVVEK